MLFFFIYFDGDVMYLIADGGIGFNSNTIDAIMLTKNLSYLDGIKLDVRMSLDNILVLAKDDDLSKTTFSKEKISKSDYQYLRRIKFRSHIFKFYIPTLNEVLKRYNHEKIILLEIHDDARRDILINELLSIMKEYQYTYYLYSSDKLMYDELKKYSLNNLLTDDDISFNKLSNKQFIITNNPIKIVNNPLFDK